MSVPVPYCYQGKDGTEEMPLERLLEVVRELREFGITAWAVEGGDPLLRFDRLFPVLQELSGLEVWGNSTGMGAEVAETANRLRPWVGDLAGTLLALIRSLWRNRRFTFFLNGEKWADCNHLLVTKMPFIASGIRIDAELGPADGRFALCVLRGSLRFRVARSAF